MAVLGSPVAAAEVEKYIKEMSPNMSFLLLSQKVPREVIAKISEIGVTDLDVFARIADSSAGMRQVFEDDVTLKPDCTANRVLLGRLLAAWDAAVLRGTKRRTEEAEQHAGDMPRKVPNIVHNGLEKTFRTLHGKQEEEETLSSRVSSRQSSTS